MEHDKKQTVYTISVLVIACMVSEWFGVWMDGAHPSLRTLHILVKTIELSTAPIITVLCSDLMTPLKHKKLIYTLISVHAGLEVLSAFFGFIFSVDAQNVYHHETFFWVYVLAYASGVLLFIGQLLSESSHHYGLYRALVIILPVFFFCGLFLQYGAEVRIMWACSAVDVLMVYILYSELTQKIDTLTHLLNRRSYESRLASLRGHAVIYYFDVDEFKSVNDTFGHGVGDAVLAEVGSTIYAVFSKVGYCYRIGGDEFCVIAQISDTAAEKYLSEFLRELTAAERKAFNKAPFNLTEYKKALEIGDVEGEAGFTTIERTGIRPSLDVNGIWGGYIEEGTKTVIPSKASAKISMRLVPGQDFKKIAKLFEKHFKAIAPKSVKVKVKFLHGGMPYVAPTDMPAYKAAEKAIADTFGKKPLPFYSGGSIPIISGFENILGIKSLLIGFGLAEDAIHSPNESYGLDQFYKGVETIPLFYKYFAEK